MLFDDMMMMPWKQARESEEAMAILARSERFFLSPKVVETCCDLARSAASVASWKFLFTPAIDTFFEWRAPELQGPIAHRAFWLIGGKDGSVTTGTGLLIRRINTQEIILRDFIYLFDHSPVFGNSDGTPVNDDPEGTIDGLNFLLAVLALLNTPRLTTLHDVGLSALNKRRAEKRQTPLLEYKTVELRLDDSKQLRVGSDGSSEPKRLHHVRSHLRIKRARVELVKPYWRGNPTVGVLIKQRVLTSEDARP
jgi:hypothetical protein